MKKLLTRQIDWIADKSIYLLKEVSIVISIIPLIFLNFYLAILLIIRVPFYSFSGKEI